MIIQPKNPVILASASPRRKQILSELGLKFSVNASHVDESYDPAWTPQHIVEYLARIKAAEISRNYPESIVIGADTIVVYENHLLGKPGSGEEAVAMLRMLSGRVHSVITAFSIQSPTHKLDLARSDKTAVRFRDLSSEEIFRYVQSGSPMDKAGAYGIQDLDANFVRSIQGCHFNVTGFPAALFTEIWNGLFSDHT